MSDLEWIHHNDGTPLTDVEEFINNFMKTSACEAFRNRFRNGYCWHFAHMLMNTFNRGITVWAAPFGHICFEDSDGTIYDIEGRYVGEAYYFIPEEFAELIRPGIMKDFKHIPHEYFNANKDDLIRVMKAYCLASNIKYDDSVDKYLCNDVTNPHD